MEQAVQCNSSRFADSVWIAASDTEYLAEAVAALAVASLALGRRLDAGPLVVDAGRASGLYLCLVSAAVERVADSAHSIVAAGSGAVGGLSLAFADIEGHTAAQLAALAHHNHSAAARYVDCHNTHCLNWTEAIEESVRLSYLDIHCSGHKAGRNLGTPGRTVAAHSTH